jgi:hypothetical protein
MASEFSESILRLYWRFILGDKNKIAISPQAVSALDLEALQEVRETLEGLAIRRHVDHVTLCWCQKRWDGMKPHEEACQRARVLMEKLRVPEVRP